jgi:acyl carrier protein
MTQTTWTSESVIKVLRDLATEDDLPAHLATGEIKDSDTVETLGIDSLGGAYLIERLEDLSGVPMPDDFLDAKDDVAKIASRMNDLIAKGG